MTRPMKLQSVSWTSTGNSSDQTPQLPKFSSTVVETTASQVVNINRGGEEAATPPPGYSTVAQLIADAEQDETERAALQDARRWLVSEFYQDQAETVRTYRLKKGMSQTQLAKAIGSSQPHIAQIESGRRHLMIETCRRLAAALDLDMNTLDQALRHQESAAATRGAQ